MGADAAEYAALAVAGLMREGVTLGAGMGWGLVAGLIVALIVALWLRVSRADTPAAGGSRALTTLPQQRNVS